MTKYRRELSLPPDDINAVHEFLQFIWDENDHIPLRDQMSFETAIIELVANIISYTDAISGLTCELDIETSDDKIEATVWDNGELIELELGEPSMPDVFSESGRGIPLIRTLVDEFSLDSSPNRNTWRMSKRLAK